MKIASAAVTMDSRHAAASSTQVRESVRTWAGMERSAFDQRRRPPPPNEAPTPPLLSAAGKAAQSAEMDAIEQASDAAANDPILILIRAMLEWMTGEAVKVFDASRLHAAQPQTSAPPPAQAPPRAGYGIEYDYRAVHEEFEQTDFSARGTIQTADGQTMDFRLDLSMSRQYRSETNVSIRAGDARRKDPLVINFAGEAAQLSNQRFRFDLTGDGHEVDVPLLAGGSGYLALDLNQNGRIDSGAELFGPDTGSGFAELASHDQDGNGWIDESDAVFGQLAVWTPAAEGSGSLATLAERQVGALYLGHLGSAFELRDQNNQDLGAVRESGIYLTASGQAGSLQEIDLTV